MTITAPTSGASPIPPPAPWRNVLAVLPDSALIYYTSPPVGCLPSSNSHVLVPEKYKPANANQSYINQPNLSLDSAKILFIVNPNAGCGKTTPTQLKNVIGQLTDMIEKAGGVVVVKYTQGPHHAEEIIVELGPEGLRQYAVIASVGGDGTLHEVANGLWQVVNTHGISDYDQLPAIAVVPLGSGNAIAVSTGLHSHLHAALNIVHGIRSQSRKPFCALTYTPVGPSGQLENEKKLLSIGGIQCGMPANIDFDTENMRWMGDLRYTIGAINYIFSGKAVTAQFEITVNKEKQTALGLPKSQRTLDDTLEISEDGSVYKLSGSFVLIVAWNSTHIAADFKLLPHASVTECDVLDFVAFRYPLAKTEMIHILTTIDTAQFIDNTDAYYYFKATKIICNSLDAKYLTVDGEIVDVGPFVLETPPQGTPLAILDNFSDPDDN